MNLDATRTILDQTDGDHRYRLHQSQEAADGKSNSKGCSDTIIEPEKINLECRVSIRGLIARIVFVENSNPWFHRMSVLRRFGLVVII
jgi:hypothetical protein